MQKKEDSTCLPEEFLQCAVGNQKETVFTIPFVWAAIFLLGWRMEDVGGGRGENWVRDTVNCRDK